MMYERRTFRTVKVLDKGEYREEYLVELALQLGSAGIWRLPENGNSWEQGLVEVSEVTGDWRPV